MPELQLVTNGITANIEEFLNQNGEVFKVFDQQDSGCISYGVQIQGSKWFIKYSEDPKALECLQNMIGLHNEVKHNCIPTVVQYFYTRKGLALIFEWLDGDVLYGPQFKGEEGRNRPESPFFRFNALPAGKKIQALNDVYEAHVYLERMGYVAVDFYDGSLLYDFRKEKMHLIDLDLYVKGAFELKKERLPGSTRFMAPEEFVKGSTIDHVTNVYSMGAAAFVFFGGGNDRSAAKWQASEKLYEVARKAVSEDRKNRFQTLTAFYKAWLEAQASAGIDCVKRFVTLSNRNMAYQFQTAKSVKWQNVSCLMLKHYMIVPILTFIRAVGLPANQ